MQHFVRYQTTFIKLSIKSRTPTAREADGAAAAANAEGATQGPKRARTESDPQPKGLIQINAHD